MEMQQPGQMYQRHGGSVYQSVETLSPWQPGIIRRLPVAGLLSILGAIIGIAASTAVLIYSDGKPIASWKFQPTVYLAIAVTLTNILLAFALSEGADIAWWRKAGKERTTVADLHRIWSHGNGVKAALLAGRKTSLVGIACILATLAQVNSPLLQRASTVAVDTARSSVKVTLRAASVLPDTFHTGYIGGRGSEAVPVIFTSTYTDTVIQWNNGASVFMNNTGCSGKCSTRVKAVGLAVNCSSYKIPYDLEPKLNGSRLDLSAPSTTGITIFKSGFVWSKDVGGKIALSVTYKNSSACTGDLDVQECTLRTASVFYPVVIDSNKSTIALDPNSTYLDDQVESVISVTESPAIGASRLGGYYLALQNKYFSNVTMRFGGAVQYIVSSQGNTGLQYIVINDQTRFDVHCSASFTNPLDYILGGARELMFRTSILAANSSTDLQSVDASEEHARAVYQSNYVYLGAAIGVTSIAIIAVLVIFRGYSEMGRSVTMSPVEIAKAFNAPMLQCHDGNASIDDLIHSVGNRSVRYGAVQEGSGPVHPMYSTPGMETGYPTEYKPFNPHVQEFSTRRRLIMGDEQQVDVPRSGETFSG